MYNRFIGLETTWASWINLNTPLCKVVTCCYAIMIARPHKRLDFRQDLHLPDPLTIEGVERVKKLVGKVVSTSKIKFTVR